MVNTLFGKAFIGIVSAFFWSQTIEECKKEGRESVAGCDVVIAILLTVWLVKLVFFA